jgi:hypothetical protein
VPAILLLLTIAADGKRAQRALMTMMRLFGIEDDRLLTWKSL